MPELQIMDLVNWTPEQRAVFITEAEREIATRSFAGFCQRMAPYCDDKYRSSPIVWGKHMSLVTNEIEAVFAESDRRRKIHTTIMRSKISMEEKEKLVAKTLGILPRLRLVILVPPRSGKSTIVAKLLPPFRWLHRPEEQFLLLTNADTLIARDGMAIKDVLDSEEYKVLQARQVRDNALKQGTKKEVPAGQAFALRKDQFAKEKFVTTAGGSRAGHVLGASYVGVDADVIVIDDPHDVDDGLNETTSPATKLRLMKEVESTYKDKVQDRLNNKMFGIVIMIMQRVHPKDLSDYMITTGAKVVCLPSEYNPEHPLRYREGMGYVPNGKDWRTVRGEVLNPLLVPKAELARMKELSPHGYATKEDMLPTVHEGVHYKRSSFKKRYGTIGVDESQPGNADFPNGGWKWQAKQLAAVLDEVAISVDCAEKDGPRNDFTSMQVWGRKGSKRVLLDRRYGKWLYPALCLEFEALVKEWPEASLKFIEDKSAGTQLCQDYGQIYTGIVPISPIGNKPARSGYSEAAFEAGNVWLPNAPWVDEYEENMVGFGAGGMHDDDVDCTSQLFKRWAVQLGPWLTKDQVEMIVGEGTRPAIVKGAAIRWANRDPLVHYYLGIVPGWANGGGTATATIVDGRGNMVSLIEMSHGGVDGFASAVSDEAEYWQRINGGRYAEIDGGPYEALIRSLAGIRVGGSLSKMAGERKAGYRGAKWEAAALWSVFLAGIGEGRVIVPDSITVTMLGTVMEDNGTPKMADGGPLSGRVLALLLAVEAMRAVPIEPAEAGMRYRPSIPVAAPAVDKWSMGKPVR